MRSLARGARRAAEAVGVALFGAMFAVFLIQIGARFLLDRPLPWTDELAVILYLAVVLWAAALLVPWREHVAMDLVVGLAPRGLRRGLVFVGAAGVAGLVAAAAPATWAYLDFMRRERTPVLDWPWAAVYAPVLLLMAAIVARGAWQALQALRDRLPEDASEHAAPAHAAPAHGASDR